jgi:hypothetical protein
MQGGFSGYEISFESDDFSKVNNVKVSNPKDRDREKLDDRYSNVKNGQPLKKIIETVIMNLTTPFEQKRNQAKNK